MTRKSADLPAATLHGGATLHCRLPRPVYWLLNYFYTSVHVAAALRFFGGPLPWPLHVFIYCLLHQMHEPNAQVQGLILGEKGCCPRSCCCCSKLRLLLLPPLLLGRLVPLPQGGLQRCRGFGDAFE